MNPDRIIPVGIDHLLVEYENIIDPVVNTAVSRLAQQLMACEWVGIEGIIPTYRSLLIQFDPLTYTAAELTRKIEDLIRSYDSEIIAVADRQLEIPVLYGGDHGPDLADVAQYNGLTPTEVIEIHEQGVYRVYMLGFNPGYPYMGGLDKRISMPRLEIPRTKVPAGSVAIGGEQTGVYSNDSPGGWRLIGHTPVRLFNPKLADPVLFRAGDTVRFHSVDQAQYDKIKAQIDAGTYQVRVTMGGDHYV